MTALSCSQAQRCILLPMTKRMISRYVKMPVMQTTSAVASWWTLGGIGVGLWTMSVMTSLSVDMFSTPTSETVSVL